MKVGDKVLIKNSGMKGIIAKDKDSEGDYRVHYDDYLDNPIDNWRFSKEEDLKLLKKELKDVEFGDMITNERNYVYIFGRIDDAIMAGVPENNEERAKDTITGIYSLPEYLRKFDNWKFVGESDDVNVTVNGKTTTISRKSAEALNLI